MRRGGFTIVELLIVIVVIAILATITIVAYNGFQMKSRATVVADNFGKIEKGLRLYGIDAGGSWPPEASFGLGENPNINNIIAATSLKNYLQTIAPVAGYPSSTYVYDNDGDSDDFGDCGQDLDGINVRVTGTNSALAQAVDDSIDDGDLNCGRVRWYPGNGGMIKYMLSEQQNFS